MQAIVILLLNSRYQPVEHPNVKPFKHLPTNVVDLRFSMRDSIGSARETNRPISCQNGMKPLTSVGELESNKIFFYISMN